jgi:hypothetical protein
MSSEFKLAIEEANEDPDVGAMSAPVTVERIVLAPMLEGSMLLLSRGHKKKDLLDEGKVRLSHNS